jgi:hypothetical protein
MSRTTTIEYEILSEVIAPERADLPPAAARSILRWKFSPKSVARMNRLAARNSQGTITESEREQLEGFLRVGSLVNLVQAKARHSLKGQKLKSS